MTTLLQIVFALTVSLPAVPSTPFLTRPLSTLGGPAQAIVTSTYSAPAILIQSMIELNWTDTLSEPGVITRAVGPCGNPRLRFVLLATVPAGGTPYLDTTPTPGDTYCYSVNGSQQTVSVPTISGLPVPPTPPRPRYVKPR